MSTCPTAELGPPRNPQKSWIPKKSQRGKVDSYLIPYRMAHSTLIKRGQAQGCSSMDITQHHCSVKARSTSPSHLDIPRSPSCWHVCRTLDHPSLPPDFGSWDHSIRSCAWDVQGGHWDTLHGWEWHEDGGWEWHEDGGWEWHEARKSKQRLAPTKNIWARTCHVTMLHGTMRIFIYSDLWLTSILY